MLTCKNFSPDDHSYNYDPDGVTYTDVVYSQDGSSVTIYLDGTTVPVTNRQSRALHRDLAIAGHDYFEVAFYYQAGTAPDAGNDVITRASWELMKDAQIKGVHGKGTGELSVNYSSTAVWRNQNYTVNEIIGYEPDGTPITGPVDHTMTVPALDPGYGAAILFVGKKTDKTLLGVGKLTSVDGATGTIITTTTRTVTFTVAALDCGVGYANYAVQLGEHLTSFLTNYNGSAVTEANTNRSKITMSGMQFDMFKLRDVGNGGSNVTSAEYYFRTNGAPISDYTNGIIVTGKGAYEKKQPRYPQADGQFQYFSVMLDDRTEILPRNNIDIGSTFENPIEVSFNTMFTEPGSMFAFVFQIPVCPLFLNAGAGTWYIRASYDSYWLDLDDGSNRILKGAGGAVLISTGSVAELSAFRIRVINPPLKYEYTWANGTPNTPNDTNNRYFNVNGLLVALEYFSGELIRYINYDELTFEIGGKIFNPRVPASISPPAPERVGDVLPQNLFGIQEVRVHYFHPQSGVTHTHSFYIILDNISGQYTNIPQTNYIVIDNNVSDSDLGNYLSVRIGGDNRNKSTFVIIFNKSFNFNSASNFQFSGNNPLLFIFVAGKANDTAYDETYDVIAADAGANSIYVGRTGPAQMAGAFRVWGTANAFYFGKWPFNAILYGRGIDKGNTNWASTNNVRYSYQQTINVPGEGNRIVHKTYNYTLNAYGPYNTASPPSDPNREPTSGEDTDTYKYFLNDGHGGRMYNVTIDPDIRIRNRVWLY